jgi:putative membrane protein
MMKMILHWIISAIAVWLTSLIVPGFRIDGAIASLLAAVVIGLVNATLGIFLKIITFPFTLITFGLFWFIINGAMLKLASEFVPGFYIRGFGAAFWGAIAISLISFLLKKIILSSHR